ncbi:MAG: integrase family protein [Gammaproteobacteria bacterium]|nr:integrase family protein [Gammaproteobacteria bacterium]
MDLASPASESLAPWMPATVSFADAPAERVRAWWERAQRAYPENTRKAWRSDWKAFMAFCELRNASPLPASPETVASFVDACRLAGKKPATTMRYLSTIALAHRVANLVNPCADEFVQLEIKGMYNLMSQRQRQAKALGWDPIKRFIAKAGRGIRADRERALLSVAYDTMARSGELVALNVEDVTFYPDGTGRVLIRRSKTDQAGEGTTAYLSRATVGWLQTWIEAAGLSEGALFRRIIGKGTIGDRLKEDAIADAFRRVAAFVKMEPKEVARVSGHSVRVGATQDLLALNIDLASVMQAGRWKSNRMPMRYGEHVLATRGGMGRAAQMQGREEVTPPTTLPVGTATLAQGAMMKLDELKRVIAQAGGGPFAAEYAERLLKKIHRLETNGRYRELLAQLRSAREAGDLRGRVLEVNFADQCERNDLHLTYGAKQGQTGDVDFSMRIGDRQVFIEMKLLGESEEIKQEIDRQLEHSDTYSIALDDDSDDLVRLQRDLIKKATTRKFSPRPEPNWINLVAVDVSELQLGAIDVADCLLAAGGNPLASRLCDSSVLRSEVVGAFEVIPAAKLTSAQAAWVAGVHNIPVGSSHPRDYIHGAMFLFRKPRERAALSYELRAKLVWNAGIISADLARVVSSTLYQVTPLVDSL